MPTFVPPSSKHNHVIIMPEQETRVFIIRHGETEWSKSGQFTGSTEKELTQEGIAQVSSAASRLVGPGKLVDPNRLVHVFVSPRVRATQTLRLLLPASPNTNPEITEDIREWDYGAYEGLKDQQIRELRKVKGLDRDREWNIWSDGCEDGESMQEITERLDRLISRIREIQEPHMRERTPCDVLLVAHGHILRCFMKRWIGFSIDSRLPVTLAPGAVAILSYKNNNVNEPLFHLGVALPTEGEHSC